MLTVCRCLQRGEGVGSLGLELWLVVNCPHGPLQEQEVRLTTKPSSNPHVGILVGIAVSHFSFSYTYLKFIGDELISVD